MSVSVLLYFVLLFSFHFSLHVPLSCFSPHALIIGFAVELSRIGVRGGHGVGDFGVGMEVVCLLCWLFVVIFVCSVLFLFVFVPFFLFFPPLDSIPTHSRLDSKR